MTKSNPGPTGGAVPSPPTGWRLQSDRGPAGEFHHRDPGPEPGHQLWIRRLPTPALVIGSTQPDSLVRWDRARADGIEVCRRRSGGGLVYVDPRTDCWIDAIVPAGSPLWEEDVGRAFHWLGQRWAGVLNQILGPAGPALVHHPRPGSRTGGRGLWCFSELGSGEVTIGGSKIVGLSQRRTRNWLRLQSLALGGWPGRRLLEYIDTDAQAAAGTEIDPAEVAAGPPSGLRLPGPEELARQFLDGLPSPEQLAPDRR